MNVLCALKLTELWNISLLYDLNYKYINGSLAFSPFKYLRTERMKNSFSRTGAKIRNSIPDSDRALPIYKFKDTPHIRLLDILIEEDTYVGVRTLIDIFSKY